MFQLFSKSFVGVDIGTFSIKVVEVSLSKKKLKLDNYGEILAASVGGQSFRAFDKSGILLSVSQISAAIKSALEESEIKTKNAVFSLPDFSTFFTSFSLPPMSSKELTQAVEFEAKRYVPIPLKDLILDWKIVNEGVDKNGEEKKDIVLAAVPKSVVEQYKEIATRAGLNLISLEAEMFGLVRILGEEEREPAIILDIGAQSTTVNIVDNNILKSSYSFDIAGNQLTRELSQNLDIDLLAAEEIKVKYGISKEESEKLINGKTARETLTHYIDKIIGETKVVCNNFERSNERKVSKIIISGGTALLPGLVEYFGEKMKMEAELANPFSKFIYPPLLKEILDERGPLFSVILGTTIKGLE